VRAADLLIQGGGFGLLALDLSDIAPRLVRQVPLNVWFRFRRAVENTPTILFLLAQESNAKTCASLVLRMEGEAGVWRETAENAAPENAAATNAQEKREHAEGNLLEGGKSWAEVVRSRMQSEDGQPKAPRVMRNRVLSIDARRMDSTRMDAAKFVVKTEWNYLRERDD
jgi:hypothetical protein